MIKLLPKSSTTFLSEGIWHTYMEFNVLTIAGLAVGAALGYVGRKLFLGAQARSAEERATTILKDTNAKAKELLLEAKDKSFKLVEEAKSDEHKRREELKDIQTRL